MTIQKRNSYPRRLENNQEFSRACKGTGLVKAAFSRPLKQIEDAQMHSRLVSRLSEILKSDPVNEFGARTIEDGELTLLEGFEFCKDRLLSNTIRSNMEVMIDRPKGRVTVLVPPFVPCHFTNSHYKYTHIKLTVSAAEVNFLQDRFVTFENSSHPAPLDKPCMTSIIVEIPKDSILPVFVAVGVEFIKEVNRHYYSLRDMGHLPLQIVSVFKAPDSVMQPEDVAPITLPAAKKSPKKSGIGKRGPQKKKAATSSKSDKASPTRRSTVCKVKV